MNRPYRYCLTGLQRPVRKLLQVRFIYSPRRVSEKPNQTRRHDRVSVCDIGVCGGFVIFLLPLFFMHELVKAVLAFALSTAAAVWLLGVALHLWPSADQLAYGNPLPYLKVCMDSGAAKFWVEDFGGFSYERVWLYVNGQLKASGVPGTDATAECGD
jgi:hypothetical protein